MIYPDERVLQRFDLCLHHSRNIAGSGLRPLSDIPHCCTRKGAGPCLSSSVADRSLKPTKDHRLGKPLPYQQSNPRQANFVAAKPLHIGHFGAALLRLDFRLSCASLLQPEGTDTPD